MHSRLDILIEKRPLAAFCAALLIGGSAGVSAPGGRTAFFVIGGAFALAALGLWIGRKPWKAAAALSAVMLLFAGYAAERAVYPDVRRVPKAEVTGVVTDAPAWDAVRGRCVFHLKNAAINGERVGYALRIYAYGESARSITVADAVTLTANVNVPSRAGNGGFDFRRYLWTYGIGQYASVSADRIAVEARDGGLNERLAETRIALQNRFDALFPNHSPILRALLLGDRSAVSEADTAAFSDAGIMHLLAVSGLHVSTLAAALTLLGSLLGAPKKLMFLLVTALLVFYAALCGGSPSVVRAAIMYCAMMGGGLLGRPGDLVTRTALACSAMLLYDPLYLWQSGFLLSFGAVFGLGILYPTLRAGAPGRFGKGRLRRAANGVADAMLGGVSVQLATLPVMASTFGRVSWISLLLNLPCIPLASAVLVLGLAAAVFGTAVPPLALLADGMTGWLTAIAHWAGRLPFGMLRVTALSMPAAILYACMMAYGAAVVRTPLKKRLIAIALLPAIVLCDMGVTTLRAPRDGLTVTFLDVGQGDGALVCAEGAYYMVDVGGDYGDAARYVTDHRVPVKAVFLSHAHDDHAAGLTPLLAVCDPETLYLPAGWDGADADEISVSAVRSAGIPVVELSGGMEIRLSEHVSARILAPSGETRGSGGNESSVLMLLTYGEGSVLFTGDLPIENEPMSVPRCGVLKVAHHGSAGSTSSRFLAMTRPDLAVISVGVNNAYGHPTDAVLNRLEAAGCEILRTDQGGAITVRVESDGTVKARCQLAEWFPRTTDAAAMPPAGEAAAPTATPSPPLTANGSPSPTDAPEPETREASGENAPVEASDVSMPGSGLDVTDGHLPEDAPGSVLDVTDGHASENTPGVEVRTPKEAEASAATVAPLEAVDSPAPGSVIDAISGHSCENTSEAGGTRGSILDAVESAKPTDTDDVPKGSVHDAVEGSAKPTDTDDVPKGSVHDVVEGSPKPTDTVDAPKGSVHDAVEGSPKPTDTVDAPKGSVLEAVERSPSLPRSAGPEPGGEPETSGQGAP